MTLEAGAPGGLTAEGETERSARITWRPLEAGNGYRVEYREADNPAVEWFGQDVFHQEGELVITNLRPDTKYEVQVGTIRERYAGNWSGKVRFRTLAPQVMACGDPTTIKAPTNTRPLATAMVGDIFQVGQFELIVTSVRGGAGRFSGTGAVLVPYLGFRLNSTFTDLRVNENKEVIDGEVIALSEGIDGWVDRWEEGEEDTGDGEGATGDADAPGEEAILEGQELRHEGEIDSVYLNGDGQIVVVDERGEETVYEQATDAETGEPVATKVVGEDGEEWVVDDQGDVTKGSPGGVSDIPGGTAETDSVLFVQKELIKEVLQHFKEEINLWLENNGKGPLDEALVRRLMALPDCLLEDENKMQEVLIKIDEFLEDPEALLNLVKEDDMNKARIEELTAKLTGDQSPYAAGLLKEEWDELLHMICPYLVVEKERPELVTIEPFNDLEFTSGINNDKLEIQYSIQTSEAYPLSHAKFQIYKNDGTLIYESDPIEIKIDGREQWDGQMNQGDRNGEFIRYDDGEFTVKVSASLKKEFGNSFEASTNARVDIDADKWRDFDHQDIGVESKYWSFETFKDLKTKYETSLEEISDQHPLDYLNESLVPVKFLGQGPFLLNIRFGYVLKLFEQSLSASKRSEYESFLTTVSFDSKLRMTSLGNGISNHALGFALDLDAPENPMITDTYIYHFIEFVTGVENFYGRRERTNAFIDELKSAHNTFVDRLNLKSGNPVTWEDLVESAEKIEAFENRKSHIQTSPLYFLADVANNTPLGDIDTIRESVESLNDAKITEEEILANCDDALAQLELNEIQITALQRVVTEYEKGMLREYYIPTELASLKEYLDVATEQIEINRTNINELKEYVALNNIQQLFQDFLNYLNELFEDEEKTAEFDKMSQLNDLNNHITALYNGFKTLSSSLDTYKKYIEKIKERVNQAGPQYGKKLMEEGFFNLRSDFIRDWFAIDYTYWGGFYGPNHDFMHLEVVNSYQQNSCVDF